MRSLPEAKALLARLYGLEFPDSLFHLQEFLAGLTAEEWDGYSVALGMRPIGPLQVLGLPEADLQRVGPTLPLVLHWRYHHDVPEFFSCLLGDQDLLHWGMLLDEPAQGFRGAASYYGNDLQAMRVYPSLFGAILERIREMIERHSATAEGGRAAAEDEANAHSALDRLRRLSVKIHRFLEERRLPVDDGRGPGLPSDTGLGLLTAERGKGWFASVANWYPRWPRSDWSVFPPTGHPRAVHFGRLKEAGPIQGLVRQAIAACAKGRPLPALSLGRSLWYWGDRSWLGNSAPAYGATAHDLLQRAYGLLDRRALLGVLEAHYHHRDLASVDLLAPTRGTDTA
jgi:hypothetical protein